MSEWIASSERRPTEADADEHGRVLVRHDDGTMATQWIRGPWCHRTTHWRTMPDQPKPAMPDRIEYVKCKPGEACGKAGIALQDDGALVVQVPPSQKPEHTASTFTLYRRVAPTKRIVFEVEEEKRVPQQNEWVVMGKNQLVIASSNWISCKRTILRLVEGAEYLQ